MFTASYFPWNAPSDDNNLTSQLTNQCPSGTNTSVWCHVICLCGIPMSNDHCCGQDKPAAVLCVQVGRIVAMATVKGYPNHSRENIIQDRPHWRQSRTFY